VLGTGLYTGLGKDELFFKILQFWALNFEWMRCIAYTFQNSFNFICR
jgi:hypothetical protein